MFQSRWLSSVASQTLTVGLLRTLLFSLCWLLLSQFSPAARAQTNVPAAAVTPAPSSFNVEAATRKDLTTGKSFKLKPLGDVSGIIEAGGIFEYARKKGMLK